MSLGEDINLHKMSKLHKLLLGTFTGAAIINMLFKYIFDATRSSWRLLNLFILSL